MFEIGKAYDVTVLEWGESGPGPVTMHNRIVEHIDGTLVKFVTRRKDVEIGGSTTTIPATEEICNTASLYFVSATPARS